MFVLSILVISITHLLDELKLYSLILDKQYKLKQNQHPSRHEENRRRGGQSGQPPAGAGDSGTVI